MAGRGFDSRHPVGQNRETAMNFDEWRLQMDAWWSEANSTAITEKNSQRATLALIARFHALSKEERTITDKIIGEWLLSMNEAKRFDALAVIDEFDIRSAVPQLHMLEMKINRRKDPGALFELEKVRRILSKLEV